MTEKVKQQTFVWIEPSKSDVLEDINNCIDQIKTDADKIYDYVRDSEDNICTVGTPICHKYAPSIKGTIREINEIYIFIECTNAATQKKEILRIDRVHFSLRPPRHIWVKDNEMLQRAMNES